MGEVIFHAEASDFNGNNIVSGSKLMNFMHKNKPVYWMIQENIGTANAPNLPAQATLNSFESYTNAVFPVPDITWVQKPWTAARRVERDEHPQQRRCGAEILRQLERHLLDVDQAEQGAAICPARPDLRSREMLAAPSLTQPGTTTEPGMLR